MILLYICHDKKNEGQKMTINKDIINSIYVKNRVCSKVIKLQIVCCASTCNIIYSSEYIWLLGKNEFS